MARCFKLEKTSFSEASRKLLNIFSSKFVRPIKEFNFWHVPNYKIGKYSNEKMSNFFILEKILVVHCSQFGPFFILDCSPKKTDNFDQYYCSSMFFKRRAKLLNFIPVNPPLSNIAHPITHTNNQPPIHSPTELATKTCINIQYSGVLNQVWFQVKKLSLL